MNKYEATANYRQNNELGYWTMAETMDRIIDKWTEENGGRMDKDDLVEMVEYIESIEWYCMASMMHGYFWGAATDNEHEHMGEQLR